MASRAIPAAIHWLAGAACFLLSTAARADAVDDWNQIVLERAAASSTGAGHARYSTTK